MLISPSKSHYVGQLMSHTTCVSTFLGSFSEDSWGLIHLGKKKKVHCLLFLPAALGRCPDQKLLSWVSALKFSGVSISQRGIGVGVSGRAPSLITSTLSSGTQGPPFPIPPAVRNWYPTQVGWIDGSTPLCGLGMPSWKWVSITFLFIKNFVTHLPFIKARTGMEWYTKRLLASEHLPWAKNKGCWPQLIPLFWAFV